MDEPSIQRGPVPIKDKGDPSRGTPLKGEVSERKALQSQAASFGIETKGLSSRQIGEAIEQKVEAQNELADFIKKTVDAMPRNQAQAANDAVPNVTTQKSEDRPADFGSRPKGSNPSKLDSEIEFYCWKDGVVGTIMLPSRGFDALEV